MITPSPAANTQDMTAAHTPGPWPITETGDGKRFVIGEGLVGGPKGYEVAEVYSDDAPYEEAIANARVIAAAPDLLIACRHLVACQSGMPMTGIQAGQYLQNAIAAIAKATEA